MANNSDFKRPFSDLFDLLPEVFQSQTNESVFRNVFNRYLSKPEIERVNGIIGEITGNAAARQLPEPTPHRQAYQLQPLLFTRIGGENTISSYVDILNELERLGVEDCRQPIWGSMTSFNWIPPVDIDKIINFRNYYWVDPVNPSAAPQYITIKNPCTQAQQRVAAYNVTLNTFGEEFPILSIDATADTFTISGDITSVFVDTFVFFVRESTNPAVNDTFFTVTSSTYDDVTDRTTISVVEDITSAAPADGVVSIVENQFVFIAEQNCLCGGDVGWGVAPWDDNQVGAVLWTDGFLPQISHPTELAWTIANGAPSLNDLWYDTTADQLKQYDGVSFVAVQSNFSSIIALVDGTHFWDFTEGCVVDDNQWIEQNKWIHENNVTNFAAAKQAQQPIIEYDANVQLNKWHYTQYDWGYRESQFIPDFTDVDIEPHLNELIPFLYQITGGSEIRFSQTHGDQTSVFVPGYQFRVLGDTSNDGVFTVSTSAFVGNQTIVSTVEAFTTISDALIPTQTEADYDGAGSNGTFVGGAGYAPGDTIDLSDGSTITVNNVLAGVVTEFVVSASGSVSVTAGIPIPQVSSSGAGLGFNLTPQSNNIVAAGTVTPQLTSVGDPFRLYDEHWILLDTAEPVPVTPRVEIPNITIDALGAPLPFDIPGPTTVGEYLTSEEVDPTFFLGPGTEYIHAMEITLTLGAIPAGVDVVFDTRMQARARTGENDIRVYVNGIRQYGQFVEIDTAGFVTGIVFDNEIAVNSIIRIEAGEPALEDIGRHSIDVLTPGGIVTQSLIEYRRAEQVKTENTQYPLFDIVNVDGTDAFMANHIFGYLTSQDAPINSQTGFRIVINDNDDFVFEQLLVEEDNGKMFAFVLNGQTQSIWRKGLNDEQYIPAYVDRDRNPVPVGDPNGFWEIPDPLYFNPEHENRRQVSFTELFSHFRTIIDAQANIPGFILPGDTFYLQVTPNYGLGGLIKEHNFSYDTLLSSTYTDNVTQLGVIDFAHDAYQNSLNLLKESYRSDAVDFLTNTTSAYIQNLSGQVTDTLITQYELNDALAFIYNDSNTFIPATNTGIKNWPATLPFIRMGFKQEPYLIEDTDQNLRLLVHHDGHRSVPELTSTTKENIIQTTLNTQDTRVNPSETFGQQSTLAPPATFGALSATTTPRSGIYWYHVSAGGFLIDSQTELNFDGLGGNGTFVGGAGFVVGDTITLSDNSIVTVDAEVAGAVTEFTLAASGSPAPAGIPVTQTATTGAGIAFSLTPSSTNVQQPIRTLYRFAVVTVGITPAIDVTPGAYWYDTATDTLRELSVGLTWDPVTAIGDGLIGVAWEEVDLDDVLADLWLEVENRLFQAAPDLTELAFDVSALPSSTVSCPDLDPTTTEEDYFNLYLQEAFGSWLRDQQIDDPFTAANFYNPLDAFTWNYKQSVFGVYPSTGNLGTETGGWWADLYEKLYLTPYPHLEPWKLQGYTAKPTWWDATYLDVPAAEETVVDFTPQTIVGGDHWLLSSPQTDYYVWYSFEAVAEETSVDFTPHTIVGGDHWLVNSPAASYHVWYTVDAAGVDPAATANPIPVAILGTDTPSQIAAKTAAAMDALPDFNVNAVAGNLINVVNAVGGAVVDAADATAGVVPVVTTQGIDANGTDPAIPGRTGIEVILVPGDVTSVIASKTRSVVNANPDFVVTTPVSNIFTITNVDEGDVNNAADVDAGVSVTIITQGGGTRRWIYGHGDTAGGLTQTQTETNYDGAGNNGTFFGGFGGYAIADTITMEDGTVITVDAEAAGVVTQFTVTTAASAVVKAGSIVAQSTTSGGGSGFTLTPQADNLTPAGMWENIRVGIVPAGQALPSGVISTGSAGEIGLTYTYFSINIGDTPTLDGVDPDGILPPFWNTITNGGTAIIRSVFETLPQVVNPSADYQFMDRGPVEFAWTQTAQRLYDDLTVSFRMEPVEFFHKTFGEEFIDVAGLNVSPDLCKVYSHKDVRFHGDIVNTNQLLQFQGLNQWYVNFNRASGFDTTSSNFRPLWQNWSPMLSYQFGSVIDTDTFQIDNPNFDLNQRDYRIALKDSVGIDNKTYEGVKVSVTGIPSQLVSQETEHLWSFIIDTFSPIAQTLRYYNVRNYPFLVDTLLNTFNLYQFNIVNINQLGGTFSIAGDQREAFTLSNQFTITSSTGNDGTYTATNVVYDSVLDETQLIVGTPLVDPTADGILTAQAREIPWQTGDIVELTSTRNLPSPLRENALFYVIRLDGTTFQLARTPQDAQAGIFINIESEGTGLHSVGEIDYKFRVSDASSPNDRTWTHYRLDRDSVLQLTPPTTQRGIQNLINFVDGYAAFEVDEGFVFNAEGTETDADLNKPISWQTEIERFLDSIYRIRSFRERQEEQFDVNINPQTDELIFSSSQPNWVTGQKVQILSYDGVVPTPLLQQAPYYVIRDVADRVQLALTRTDALLGNEIDILTGGTGRIFLQAYVEGKRTVEVFEINPARNNLWVQHDQGILSNIDVGRTVDIRNSQLITDQNGEKLTTEELAVFRQDKLSRINVQNSSPDPSKPTAGQNPARDFRHISTANIFIDGTECVIIFNDDSVEGFLIYDPFLGLNTKYFEVLFFRQDEFTQRPVVGGYFLTPDDQLIRNIESSVIDLAQAYDTYQALETTDLVIEGRRSLGYSGTGTQDYLTNLNVSPKTQFAFWRGFIQSKGSTLGIDAYVNSRNFDGASVDEYWAFKVAEFGSPREQEYPELNLIEQDAQRTEKRFEFLDLSQEAFDADDTFEPIFSTNQTRWHNQPDVAALLADNNDTFSLNSEITDVWTFFGALDGSTRIVADGSGQHAIQFRSTRHPITEDLATDQFTFVNDDPGWRTGQRIRFDGSSVNISLPQPLLTERDYFAIRVAPNVVSVAETRQDALDGNAIDIQGTLINQNEISYDGLGGNGTFTAGTDYSAGGVIEGQTQADYNNIGDNGTFAAGVNYAIGETITMTDMSVVTVTAISGGGPLGPVAQFTISSASNLNVGLTLFQLAASGSGSGFSLTLDDNNRKAEDVVTLSNGATVRIDQIVVGGAVTEFTILTVGTGVELSDVLSQISLVSPTTTPGTGFSLTVGVNNFVSTQFGSPYMFDPGNRQTPVYWDDVYILHVDTTTTPPTLVNQLIEGVDYEVINSQLVTMAGDPALGYPTNGFTPLTFGDEEYRLYAINPAHSKHNPAKIIDIIDDIVIEDVPLWDPRRNHQYHIADNVVTIETNTDPATYNTSLDSANVGNNFWIEPEVGEVWWDTSSREYVPYHDKTLLNLESRSQGWGRLSDWAVINLYQWTESDLPPSEFDAQAAIETTDITIDPRVRKSGTAKADTFRRERAAFTISSVNVSNAAADANKIFITDLNGDISVGDRVVFSTTDELPLPLQIGTFYFVVEADAPGANRGLRVSLTEGGTVLEIQPGAATVDVNGVAVTGLESTGLLNDFDTAGIQDVDFTVAKTLGSPTGLALGTSGFDRATFSVVLAPATATGLTAGGSGSQTVDYNPGITGGTATGLAPGSYGATITIDGIPINVFATDVTAPNFTGLLSVINGAIAGAGVATISGGDIVITSNSSGPGSSVSIVDNNFGGFIGLLFASTANFSAFLPSVPGSLAPNFSATIEVDGGTPQLIEDSGSNLQTMQQVLDLINGNVSGAAATLVGTEVRITSNITGNSSTVLINDPGGPTGLFSNMTNIVTTSNPVGGTSTDYFAEIAIDNGGNQLITVAGDDAQNFAQLLALINQGLSGAEATLAAGNIRITSNSTGATSTVDISSTPPAPDLFASLANFNTLLPPVDGIDATSFTTEIDTGFDTTLVTVVGNQAQTYTELVSSIAGQLPAATVNLEGGNIVIASGNNQISITNDNLFANLTDFVQIFNSDTGDGTHQLLPPFQDNWVQLERVVKDLIPARDRAGGGGGNLYSATTGVFPNSIDSGDNVDIYINGAFFQTQEVINGAVILEPADVGNDTFITLVKEVPALTAEETAFDPDVFDDGSNLVQRKLDYNFSVRDTINEFGETVQTYYFWVNDKTTRDPESNNPSLVIAERELETIPIPYLIADKLLPQGTNQPAGVVTPNLQQPGTPQRYSQAIIKGLAGIINDNNRYVLRFTNDQTLRDELRPRDFPSDAFVSTEVGQTEAAYTGIGSFGTFTAGTGHAVGDVLVMGNSAEVRVDAIGGGGAVTGFTIISTGAALPPVVVPYAQISTSGSGTGFTLTPNVNNYKADFSRVKQEPLDLKNLHAEWTLLREGQPFKIDRALWDRITEAVIGRKLDNAAVRVPSLERELYDIQFNSQTQYGFDDGQAFVNGQLALATTIDDIEDPNNDFAPVDINAFFTAADTLTEQGLIDFYDDIYNMFSVEDVNRIYFKILLDALTTKDEYPGVFKTSWVSLEGTQLLQTEALVNG